MAVSDEKLEKRIKELNIELEKIGLLMQHSTIDRLIFSDGEVGSRFHRRCSFSFKELRNDSDEDFEMKLQTILDRNNKF